MFINRAVSQRRIGTTALMVVAVSVLGLVLISSFASRTADAAGAQTATRISPIPLDPDQGSETGAVFQAFLSPHQEGGEESDTPSITPAQFRSTAPSVPRNERPSRGHGVIEFTKDLSKAYVYLAVKGVKLEDINMLHLHCGRPGQLGPILVDFSLIGDVKEMLASGTMMVEVTNELIVATAEHGMGIVGAFTAGCPIVQTIPNDRVKTVAGMEVIARQGELYFNLHTKGQTYFGDIRGQLELATVPNE